MRFVKTVVTVLVSLLMLAGTLTSVSAQEDPGATPEAGVPEGLEQWFARSYVANLTEMIDPATPEAERAGLLALSANVLEFESEDKAAAAADDILAQLEASGNDELEEVELDLDFDYTAVRAELVEEGVGTLVVLEVVVQDGEFIYAVVGQALGEMDSTELIESATQAMYDAEVGDDEEVFSADGTSEGGLWAKLPTTDEIAEEEPSLVNAEDTVVYPVPEPEATPAP